MHLRPAGDAGLHVVAVGVILDLLDEFVVVADRKIARFLRQFGNPLALRNCLLYLTADGTKTR